MGKNDNSIAKKIFNALFLPKKPQRTNTRYKYVENVEYDTEEDPDLEDDELTIEEMMIMDEIWDDF